jgi:hypothetical protein
MVILRCVVGAGKASWAAGGVWHSRYRQTTRCSGDPVADSAQSHRVDDVTFRTSGISRTPPKLSFMPDLGPRRDLLCLRTR